MAIDFREIQLTPEQQRRVAELAERSGKPWDEVIKQKLADVREAGTDGMAGGDEYLEDYDAWLAHFQDWMSRQRARNPHVDDSRESIYPDRW